MNKLLTSLYMLSLLTFSEVLYAHPYFEFSTNSKVTYKYQFEVKSDRKEFTQSNTIGKMHVEAKGLVDLEHKEYMHYVTSYEDIPYMTTTAEYWRREDGGNLYIASSIADKVVETLELPANTVLNSEWDYNDGEPSKRKVTKILDLEINKHKFVNCLEVTRIVLKNPKFSTVDNKVYYCPKIGDVKSVFNMPSPVGDYVTTTEVLDF